MNELLDNLINDIKTFKKDVLGKYYFDEYIKILIPNKEYIEKEFKLLKLAVDNGYTKAYHDLGVQYFFKKDYDMAKLCYEKVSEYDIEYKDALANLGWIYNKNKDFMKAEELYIKSIALNCDYAKLYYAQFLFDLKRFEESYNLFKNFKTSDSSYYLAIMYANGYYVKKDIVKAIDYMYISRDKNFNFNIEYKDFN